MYLYKIVQDIPDTSAGVDTGPENIWKQTEPENARLHPMW